MSHSELHFLLLLDKSIPIKNKRRALTRYILLNSWGWEANTLEAAQSRWPLSWVSKDEWSSPGGEGEEEPSRKRHQLESWNTDSDRHAIFGHGERFRVSEISVLRGKQ